jgi:hypothetical protein
MQLYSQNSFIIYGCRKCNHISTAGSVALCQVQRISSDTTHNRSLIEVVHHCLKSVCEEDTKTKLSTNFPGLYPGHPLKGKGKEKKRKRD